MILVGLNIESINCVGHGGTTKTFFECDDIHEAAIETLKCNHSNSFWVHSVLSGEFHDTETKRTWSVDSGGHTQKDYHNENSVSFRRRWNEEKESGHD